MQIRSIQILNYKSFRDSGVILVPSSFTIVTGPNNSGKTALAQAISLTIDEKPHRSLATAPTPTTPSRDPSNVQLQLALSTAEFYELALIHGSEFNLPKEPNTPDETLLQNIRSTFASGTVPILLDYQPGHFAAAYLDIPTARIKSQFSFQFSVPSEGTEPELRHTNTGVRMDATIPYLIASDLRSRIYLFKAERFNVGQHKIGQDPTLLPDASNLAQALNNLQTSNPSKYEELITHVRTIFPDVSYITIPPLGTGEGVARIAVWPVPTSTQRADLAIPLQESGTGLGQVLAILYVAVSAVYPRCVVIDEPQSFLHPGAIRKLIGILQSSYPQHQYIVTTHSPVVLASATAPAIIHLAKPDAETTAQPIHPSDTAALRSLLADVGARLSDVFGADNILWVEGTTEESCLPIIITRLCKHPSIGTVVVGVLSVGELQSKDAARIISLYNRLTKGNALLPTAIGFLFDREGKSNEEQQDIARRSRGVVRFLPRRMYENYLLHPGALASVISSLTDFPSAPVPELLVTQWLKSNGCAAKYFPNGASVPDAFSPEWLSSVDAARLLQDLFLHLSSGTYEYRKVEFGTAITTYLCDNSPEDFSELALLLEQMLGAPSPDASLGA